MASNGEEHTLNTFSLSKSCPIHFGPLKQPKSLPCGHAFCLNCLKPYASSNRIVCPLCNTVHKVDIYLLPNGHRATLLEPTLLEALPSSAEEYMTKSKALATQNALKNAESACDMAVELLDSMKEDFRDMQVSFGRRRQSITDELKQLDQESGMSEEEKRSESRALSTACDLLQRLCTMAQDKAFHNLLQVSKDVEDACQCVKSIGLCRYYLCSESELDEALEKKLIGVLTSLVQQYANSDYDLLCERMVTVFPERFKDYKGIWTAVVGDTSLDWNVPSDLMVQGRTSDTTMVVYCGRQKGINGTIPTHKLGLRVSQVRLKSIIETEHRKDSKSSHQAILTRISKRIDEEFGGKWHCITGKTGKFVIKSNGTRNFLLKEEYEDWAYVCWKYYLEGNIDQA